MNEISSGVLEELLHCATHARESKILRIKGSWQEDMDHVEADAFWVFAAIVSGPCRDAFIADNDCSVKAESAAASDVAVDMSRPDMAGGGGLVARLSELERRVRLAAPNIYKLVHKSWAIRPHVYAARWYSVLFRREYQAGDNDGSGWQPKIWDYMFAYTSGNDDDTPRPWGEPQADWYVVSCGAWDQSLRAVLVDPWITFVLLRPHLFTRHVVLLLCSARVHVAPHQTACSTCAAPT